jgi:hypothetical protein
MTSCNMHVVAIGLKWPQSLPSQSPAVAILYQNKQNLEKSAFRQTVYKWTWLTLSNPIFLPPVYSPALIYFWRERGRWVTCNFPTVLKEKNRNRKSITYAICWLKSVQHEEKLGSMRMAEKLDWKRLKRKKSVGNRKIIMSDEVRHRIGKGNAQHKYQ